MSTVDSGLALRPYQADCLHAIYESFESHQRSLVVMPTGTGKTVVFSTLCRDWPSDKRILILAHLEELIFQAAEKVHAITGERPAIEMGDEWSCEASAWHKARVVVSSVQTMSRMKRRQRFNPREFDLIICDEAHRSRAPSYEVIFDYFDSSKILGCTATPDRLDKKALGKIYQDVAFQYWIDDAIDDGWLVPVDQAFCEVPELDFSGVNTTDGDFDRVQLQRLVTDEGPLHKIAHGLLEHSGDKKTLVFTAGVPHAHLLAEVLDRYKAGQSVALDGKTDKGERRQQLKRYKNGEFQYLLTCGLFVEGFDDPYVEVVANARPTKSRSRYAQTLGRGTRVLPGVVDGIMDAEGRREAIACSAKPCMLMLDFVGQAGEHKLVSSGNILGGRYDDEVVQLATESAKKKSAEGYDADMMQELKAAQKAREEAEARKRAHVKAKALGQSRLIRIDPFDVLDVKPPRASRKAVRRATPKQEAFLRHHGVSMNNVDFKQASKLIEGIKQRQANRLCTYKQAAVLKKFKLPTNVSEPDAAKLMKAINASGGRRPSDTALREILGAKAEAFF